MTNVGSEVPKVVIGRLPQYLRALTGLNFQGVGVVSSQQLGAHLQVTPAQIRKDLSYFGRFGKQGRGYPVEHLIERLRLILSLDRSWNVALVGVGRLGRAIVSYPGFAPEGFHVVCAFDSDPGVAGCTVDGVRIHPMADMRGVLHALSVRIAIVAVPAHAAQDVISQLVSCGIKAILNYAPTSAQVPATVHIQSIDPVLALQSMTYYVEPNGTSTQAF